MDSRAGIRGLHSYHPRILRATFHFVISRRGSERVRRTLDILPPPNERGGPKNLRRLDLEGRGCLARPLRARLRPVTRRLARVVSCLGTGNRNINWNNVRRGGRTRTDATGVRRREPAWHDIGLRYHASFTVSQRRTLKIRHSRARASARARADDSICTSLPLLCPDDAFCKERTRGIGAWLGGKWVAG